MQISELQTPVPVVDIDCVRENIRRLQEYCDQHRIRLRPHIKTHKIPLFAHEQIKGGAVGITVQKIGEAEAMAYAGLDDVLLTFNVLGAAKADRVAKLTNFTRITVGLDNRMALESIARCAREAKHPIGVLIEFESGGNRQGVQTPDQAFELARAAMNFPNIEFRGLMTFPTTSRTKEFLNTALPLFKRGGIGVEIVSGGGTQPAFQTHDLASSLNEMRAGTYIYNDRMMVESGAAKYEQCAFEILSTVVSRPASDRAVLDAGSKTLSSDLLPGNPEAGYGFLPDYPKARIARLSEEHGMVDLISSPKRPEIGERLRIIPNHVCVVTNLHDHIHLHRRGEVLARLPVVLRGLTV